MFRADFLSGYILLDSGSMKNAIWVNGFFTFHSSTSIMGVIREVHTPGTPFIKMGTSTAVDVMEIAKHVMDRHGNDII